MAIDEDVQPTPAGSSPAPVPAPPTTRPVPGPPGGRPAPPPTQPAPPAVPTAPDASLDDARTFGRVAEDGSVFVTEGGAERYVGQLPDSSPDEALLFFARRFAELAFEVDLLETRVGTAALSPEEAGASVKKVRESLVDAHAVGDFAALTSRLDALDTLIAQQREQKRAERAAKLEEARGQKERIAIESETLAASNDWRNGANRLRELLDEWKGLPRLDKATDDTLWRRFSTARTTYTRRRKTHFTELNSQREVAQTAKEKLVAEAEKLATSTDWGNTSKTYRDLMQRWKAAGSAPKGIDDQLWKRFRAAQDQFFGARDAANAALDTEFAENAAKKEEILADAEKLLPITDLTSAKAAFRDISERWDAAGKVPRERIKDLEGRLRKVEQAIRGLEDETWRKSDPEKSARANDVVTQLESAIAKVETDLEKAKAAGDAKKVADLEANLESRRMFLEAARRASADFA